MASEQVQGIVNRLRAAQESFEKEVAAIPADRFHQAPKEGEWSPAHIVAHVCESPSFFAAKIVRVTKEDDVFYGRTKEEGAVRLQAIAEHAGDSKDVALRRLKQVSADVVKTLAALSDDQLARAGRHPQHGTFTIQQGIDYIIAHINEHVQQLADMRAK